MGKTNGEQILKGLAETRRFFEQLSLLLRAADDLMAEKGWERYQTRCHDVRQDVARPKEWMPFNVYSYYTISEGDDNYKDLLVCIGVLLDRIGNSWSGYKEPWITCGFFKFRPEKVGLETWEWQYSWIESYLEYKKDPDGSFHAYKYSKDEELGDWLLYEESMALPLIEITNLDELKSKILDSLLERISNLEENSKQTKKAR